VGILDTKGVKVQSPKVEAPLLFTAEELSRHNSPEDCWVALFGTVYDLTEFSKHHPGGSYIIQKVAGKDGTANYRGFHPQSKLETIQAAVVGKLFVDKTLAVES
jgi:cytochrome b involved in lipid metabolism